jgi:hypothetical protein
MGIHRNGLKQRDETANNQHETMTQREINECQEIVLGKTTVAFGG